MSKIPCRGTSRSFTLDRLDEVVVPISIKPWNVQTNNFLRDFRFEITKHYEFQMLNAGQFGQNNNSN